MILEISSSIDNIDELSLLCELACERLILELFEMILCIVHNYEVFKNSECDLKWNLNEAIVLKHFEHSAHFCSFSSEWVSIW